jgi:sigma-B regulation protein RsbU (phosphoserine phosphatase)
MPQVLIISGPGAGRNIAPAAAGAIIGRQPNLEVTLDSAAVSRRHARLTWELGQVFVEDLGSSNGTFVNDTKITRRTRIRAGDSLRIGTSLFRLDATTAAAESDMTIQSLTAAATSNEEIYRDNAADKLRAVLQLAHQLGRSLDPEDLLRRLLDRLLVLFPKADRALALRRDEDTPVLQAAVSRRGQMSAPAAFSHSVLRRVFGETVAVLAEDTRQAQSLAAGATLASLGIQSVLCVPLQAQNGRVFGALQLDRSQAGKPFSPDDLYLLTAVALMVAPVLENAELHGELIEKERLQRELALAREIQLSYLPRERVWLAGGPVELAAELHPAFEVSGDFYDYFPLDAGRLAFAVADVSGKGMAAALFMTQVHALARHLAQSFAGPADLLAQLNNAIARDNPGFFFVTVALGVYDAATGRLVLAHGGHPPSLLRRRDGTVEEIAARGAPLVGLQPDVRRSEEAVIDLAPGDSVILYTDGVTESPRLDSTQELFGTSRLMDAVRNLPASGDLPSWIAAIRGAVSEFSGPDCAADDITVLALRRPEHPTGPT